MATARFTSFSVISRIDQERGDKARKNQHPTHNHRCGNQKLFGIGDTAYRDAAGARVVFAIFFATVNQGHDGDPGLEATEAQGELGKHQQSTGDQQRKIARRGQRGMPSGKQIRVCHDLPGAAPKHDDIEREVRQSGRSRQADRLAEALQKNQGEHREDHEGDEDLALTKDGMQKGIFDRVLGCVGCRQRHRDHEICGRETEQH